MNSVINKFALNKLNKRKNIISVILLVFLILAIIFSVSVFAESEKDTEIQKEKQIKVKTITVGKNTNQGVAIVKTVQFVKPNSADVVAEYSGYLQSVPVEIGQQVRKRQILAIFDQTDSLPNISAQSAQDNLILTQKNLKQTKKLTDEMIKVASETKKIKKNEYDEAKASGDAGAIELARRQYEIAKAQEEQTARSAKIQINGVESQLVSIESGLNQSLIAQGKTILRSPISGTIIASRFNQNDYVTFGQTVFSIVANGDESLEGKLYLSGNEINGVQVGDEVMIKNFGKEFIGKIKAKSNFADNFSGKYEVVISISNYLDNLVNQSADALIFLDFKNDGIFVPLSAIIIGQTNSFVFIVSDDNKALKKEVELGKVMGDFVEVLSGLNDDDILVVERDDNLFEGISVIFEQ